MTEPWIKVAEFSLTFNVKAVEERLLQQDIVSRLTDESDRKILWVQPTAPISQVVDIVRQVTDEQNINGNNGWQWPGFKAQLKRTPVVLISLLLSIVGAMVTEWQFQWLHWLTFQDFTIVNNQTAIFGSHIDALQNGQYWRLITPIFIHFGIFHLAFNCLWLWEFGRRIETFAGSFHLLMIVFVAAVASNWSQYLWSGPSLFGGMSGVLYALLGYLWIYEIISPNPKLAIPKGIVGFMLVWLLLCMTGVIDLMMKGNIANAAHLSGLIVGMLLGTVFGLLQQYRKH